jgi:hypothetical protein
MPWRRISVLAGVLLVSSTLASTAQVYNSADFVRSLYQRYLGREPSSNELTQWVWAFQKGMTLTEAQVTFLSSDDYFARHGRNPTSFVTGLFTEVLNRAPSQAEVTAWVNSLNAYRGNREKLVRDFLKAAQQELTQRAPLPTTNPRPSGASAQDGQLSATARLLRDALEDELGGTQQGRQLAVVSRNLVNASRNLETAIASSPASDAYVQAYRDVHQTLSALEDGFQTLRFSVPNSSAYLDRYLRIFESLESTVPQVAPTRPSAPVGAGATPTMDAPTYNEVLRLNTALSSDTQQLLYMLRSMVNTEESYKQLLRDVEFFYAQVDAFQHTLSAGTSMADVRNYVSRLRAIATGISQNMRMSVPAGGIVQRWNVVNFDVQQVGELVGVSTGSMIDPGQPVLYNAPTYSQLPYQVHRPMPTQTPRRMVPAIDEAVAHVNAFVVGFNRFVPYYAQVPALQTQARSLRLALIQLRQEATGAGSPQKQRARLSEANQLLDVLNESRKQLTATTQLANAPDLSEVNLAVQRINEVFLSGSDAPR